MWVMDISGICSIIEQGYTHAVIIPRCIANVTSFEISVSVLGDISIQYIIGEVYQRHPMRRLTHPEKPVRLPRKMTDNARAIYTSVTTAVTVSMLAGISARARLAARTGFCTLPGGMCQHTRNSSTCAETYKAPTLPIGE